MKTTSHIFKKIFLDNCSEEKLTLEELERIAAKYSAEQTKIEIKLDVAQSKPISCAMPKGIVKNEIPFNSSHVTKKRRC